MAFWLFLQDLECSVEDRPEMSVIHCFDPVIDPKEIILRSQRDPRIAAAGAVAGLNVILDRLWNVKC